MSSVGVPPRCPSCGGACGNRLNKWTGRYAGCRYGTAPVKIEKRHHPLLHRRIDMSETTELVERLRQDLRQLNILSTRHAKSDELLAAGFARVAQDVDKAVTTLTALEAELARLSAPVGYGISERPAGPTHGVAEPQSPALNGALTHAVTDAEVAEVLTLDEKRTPGEWSVGINYPSRVIANLGCDDAKIVCGTCLPADEDFPNEQETIDAAFIAAAPRMGAIIRRLWAQQATKETTNEQ